MTSFDALKRTKTNSLNLQSYNSLSSLSTVDYYGVVHIVKSKVNQKERFTGGWWMCASICHRWGPGRLPNHQHHQRLSTQKKIALWRPSFSLSTRTLSSRQLVLFTNPNVFSSSVWALVSPLPAETLWSERGQDIDPKIVQSESMTFITWTDVRRVVLLLQRSLQGCSINAEVSRSAQLHVLHQIHLDKHTNGSRDQHFNWCRLCCQLPSTPSTSLTVWWGISHTARCWRSD